MHRSGAAPFRYSQCSSCCTCSTHPGCHSSEQAPTESRAASCLDHLPLRNCANWKWNHDALPIKARVQRLMNSRLTRYWPILQLTARVTSVHASCAPQVGQLPSAGMWSHPFLAPAHRAPAAASGPVARVTSGSVRTRRTAGRANPV
jgi:hypothetical protein